jgi:hypothetical protein
VLPIFLIIPKDGSQQKEKTTDNEIQTVPKKIAGLKKPSNLPSHKHKILIPTIVPLIEDCNRTERVCKPPRLDKYIEAVCQIFMEIFWTVWTTTKNR